MKKPIACFLFSACILVPMSSQADLLIYKGIERESITGETKALHINAKTFVIIDMETSNFARISYTTINGVKRLSTSQHTNAHVVQVVGANSRMFSVLSHIPTDCDAQESSGKEGVYLKGVNATLTVSSNATITFPKILTDSGGGLSHSKISGDPYLTEGSIVLAFNKVETLRSNNAGENLDAAFNRLVAYVESLGYTQ